jgi:YVTN family beta-propeller protein
MSEFLYVPNEWDSTVSVINNATNSVVATIPVGGTPDTVAIRPDGAFAYVACESGVVSVIDTASNTVVSTINVGSGAADVVAFSPNGTLAYVTHYSGDYVSVIDTASNSLVATIPVGSGSYGIAFNADGTRAYAANEVSGTVAVIDTASSSVIKTITVGSDPTMIAVSPDGSHAYVNNFGSGTTSVIDTASNSVVATINVGGGPYGIVISPDGTHAYVAGSGTVSVIDTASNMVVGSFDAGGPVVGIAISHDGTHLYVTNFLGSNTVSVIDIASETVVDTINVGTAPEYPAMLDIAPVPVITSEVLSKSGVVTLTGTTAEAAEANDKVAIYDGTTLLGTTRTASDGTWSFTTGKASDAVHTYTATATDFVGNVGHSVNEAILGSSKADSLVGTSGNDIINGNGGNDRITGGLGADTLSGGSGKDTFAFNAISDSTPSSHDTITDFSHGQDKIDFTNIAGINASGGVPTFQGNLTGSGNLTLNPHSVAYIEVSGNTLVLINTTNAAEIVTSSNVSAANMEIDLVGTNLHLTSTDFHHF